MPLITLIPSSVIAQNPPLDAAVSDTAAQPQELGTKPETEMLLVCDGSTFTVAPTSQTNAFVTDNRGNMAVGSAASSAPANVGFQVRLCIIGEKAEMNVPAIAVPAFSRGNLGWYKVKTLWLGSTK